MLNYKKLLLEENIESGLNNTGEDIHKEQIQKEIENLNKLKKDDIADMNEVTKRFNEHFRDALMDLSNSDFENLAIAVKVLDRSTVPAAQLFIILFEEVRDKRNKNNNSKSLRDFWDDQDNNEDDQDNNEDDQDNNEDDQDNNENKTDQGNGGNTKLDNVAEGTGYLSTYPKFKDIKVKRDRKGKYVEIGDKKYYKYKNGCATGYVLYNDFIFVGEIKNRKVNGRGIMIKKDGDVYEGEIKNNEKNGHGKYTFANGDVYEGYWENDKRHGHGKITYGSDDIFKEYDGNWENDEYSNGKFTGRDGSTFEWEDGVMVKIVWYNGDIQEGEFNSDDEGLYGRGTYTFRDTGNKYKGDWKDGNFVGGTFIDNGTNYEVTRKDGKLVIESGGDESNNGKYVYEGKIVDERPSS